MQEYLVMMKRIRAKLFEPITRGTNIDHILLIIVECARYNEMILRRLLLITSSPIDCTPHLDPWYKQSIQIGTRKQKWASRKIDRVFVAVSANRQTRNSYKKSCTVLYTCLEDMAESIHVGLDRVLFERHNMRDLGVPINHSANINLIYLHPMYIGPIYEHLTARARKLLSRISIIEKIEKTSP